MVEGDIPPPNTHTNITSTEVLVNSKQKAAATEPQSDAIATLTTAITASATQPPAIARPATFTKAPTTLKINTEPTHVLSTKPISSPPLPSPRIVKLPATPSSQSTSTSHESLLTKRSHSPNIPSSSAPQSTIAPPAPPAEKRVRVDETNRFESPSKVLLKDVHAPPPSQSASGQASAADIYPVLLQSPTRNGRTVFLASSDSSPIADHAFTIKPGSTSVNLQASLPPSALAGPCLQFYSTAGCSRTSHCRFTHVIPTIGTVNWLTLRQNLIKSAKSKQMARTLQPQPYLGLGLGFTSVNSEWSSAFVYDKTLVSYCMKSFFTVPDACDKGCDLCHDLPLVTSAEWTLLKADLLTVSIRARESFRGVDFIPSLHQLGLDIALQPMQPTTAVPNLNRDPCLYHHSELGCWDLSCAYDHSKPVIGSTKWKQLKNRLEQLAKSPRYMTQFRNIRPQAYLGMGIGFEKTLHHKITYCLPSFTTVGCNKGACIRCHDLPQEESFEWAFLSDVLMQDIKDNQPQKYNDTFDLLPELKRRGLAMPTQPTSSVIEANVVLSPAVVSSRPSSASTSSVAAVDYVPSEPPISTITSTVAVMESHEPISATGAADLIIPNACTAQDLLYLHTTETEASVPTTTIRAVGAPVKSPVVTFTLKGTITPPLSVPTPVPVSATSPRPPPCLHFYSTIGCGHKACKLNHAMPRIGTDDWYTLRERLQQESITEIQSTLQPVSYLGLGTGFKALDRGDKKSTLVTYCLPSYTSLRCGRSLSCHLCHQSPGLQCICDIVYTYIIQTTL